MRLTRYSRHPDLGRVTVLMFATLILLQHGNGNATASGDDRLIAFVAIDDESASSVGKFPLDRKVYGRVIEMARRHGAKGVALKFFFDRASAPESDAELGRAIREFPVVLQVSAAEAGEGAAPTGSIQKLFRPDWRPHGDIVPFPLADIVLPIDPLLRSSAALGFVDARPDGLASKVEVIAKSGQRYVSSMQVAIVELATGFTARVDGRTLKIGKQVIPLDKQGRMECRSHDLATPPRYGIGLFLEGKLPADAIRGRVVVLGYTRANSPTLPYAGRQMPIHEIFFRQLSCLARLVEKGHAQDTR